MHGLVAKITGWQQINYRCCQLRFFPIGTGSGRRFPRRFVVRSGAASTLLGLHFHVSLRACRDAPWAGSPPIRPSPSL
jgi:hypothetical protein